MQTIHDTLLQMNELMTDSFKQLSNINSKAYDQVVKSQTELANVCVRTGLKQMELAKEFKDTENFIKQQKEVTRETVEELQKFTTATVQLAATTRDDIIGWMENNIKATASINPASKAA